MTRRRHPRRVVQCLIEVGAVQYVITGEDLLGHRERPVSQFGLTIAHTNRRRGGH
jgi:hypothetical protein